MKKIRIKNDISVSVQVTRDGLPEGLEGKEILLFMKVGRNEIPIEEYTINGNTISFDFKSKNQIQNGIYNLTIQIQSTDATNTVDFCGIFELVPCTCMAGGDNDFGNANTESIEGTVEIGIMGGGENIPTTSNYNDLQNKPSINQIILQGDITLAAIGAIPVGGLKTINGESIEGEGNYQIPTLTSELTDDIGFLTEHQDISNLVTVEELASGLAEKQPKGDYALASDIPSLAGYATEQWVTSQINNAIDGLSTEIVSINDLVGTDTEGGIA